MSRIAKRLLLAVMILCWWWFGIADDGMWMPHQMKELNLTTQGLTMDPGQLYKEDGTGLMNAVVRISKGGTGAFVSRTGLVLTNHHVAFSAIQRASDPEHDYLSRGFLAPPGGEEIPAYGYYIDVLLGYEDVTPLVLKELKPHRTPSQRYKALDRIEKQLVAGIEKKGKDLIGDFKSMYSGNKYYLFTFKRLWDVRIVYAPPIAVGDYGGETDNWMWPRHTADFTFLRAYVSRTNEGVHYHPDNVPYRPASLLKISPAGVREGDFTFIMGYPGKTQRSYTFSELQAEIDSINRLVNTYRKIVAFFEEAGANDQGIRIKYASTVKSLYNGLKNRVAKLEGFQKHAVPQKKKEFDETLMQWIKQQPERQGKYGDIVSEIEKFMQRNTDSYRKKQQLENLVEARFSPVLLSQAYLIFRTVSERQKPDLQRDKDFQERALPEIQNKIEVAERSYLPDTDKAYLKFLLKEIQALERRDWPAALVPILEKDAAGLEKEVDQLYAATVLTNPVKRSELLKVKPTALMALNDPLLKLAAALDQEFKVLRDKEKILEQERADLKQVYLAALLEMTGGKIAPDANSSIRFTCGPVKSYQPRDGVTYLAQTTLTGVMEKETGTFPFEVPGKLKQLYRDRDFGPYMDKHLGNIPTCFLNTTNVTGGSSGSPTLNAAGEMTGIVFDMVYESVIGDFYIVPELQRVISVDIRYVLFLTDKFTGAGYLLKEMGL